MEILLRYVEIVENLRKNDPTNPGYEKIMFYARRSWPSAIRAIKRHQRESPQDDLRKKVLQKWVMFGKRLSLTETDDFTSDDWGLQKPCHWKGCLCLKLNSNHPMRVCKGCWNVYYCNTKCQTR